MALIGMQLGHYTLTKLVGSGGMGEVYLAEDARMHRLVAIKILRSEASAFTDAGTTREATRLFQREMSIITSLDHPRILPMYDYGEEKMEKVTLTYMVMPYRPEGSLEDWLQRRGTTAPLPSQDTAFFIQQAGEALQYAHDHSVIHQDVKPSNFLTWSAGDPARPNLLLADFGIAKVLSATSSSSQSVRGTPAYMPPEQWDGHPVQASDQYALAIMTYLLLTAKLPFTGRPEQVMRGHFFTLPPPPSSVNPQLSSAVDTVILRALAKAPSDRFPSIMEFVKALLYESARFATNVPNPLTPIPPPPPQLSQATATDLQATLTISPSEAMNGVTRSLNLPGGRQVSVQIPPRAYSGQAIRLNGMGQPRFPGGPNGDVIITLAITSIERASNLPTNDNRWNSSSDIRNAHNGQQEQQQQVVVLSDTSSNPNIGSTRLATPEPFPLPRPVPGPMPTPTPGPTRTPGPKKRMYIIALVAVALLVVLASIGIFTVSTINTNNANATATANTGTAIANTSATNAANNTAHSRETATAVAQANQQATVSAQATATFIQQNPDPYINGSTIDFADPLNNTAPSQFAATTNSTFGGSCAFNSNNLAINQTIKDRFYICYSRPQFNNFVFEVHMVIVKGDCGGFTFRDNTSSSQLYVLFVCQDGFFKFMRYTDTTATNAVTLIPNTFSSNISTGLGVENVLAVVANGSTLSLYANRHQLGGNIQDSNYSSGALGLLANDVTSATQVTYFNARLWTL